MSQIKKSNYILNNKKVFSVANCCVIYLVIRYSCAFILKLPIFNIAIAYAVWALFIMICIFSSKIYLNEFLNIKCLALILFIAVAYLIIITKYQDNYYMSSAINPFTCVILYSIYIYLKISNFEFRKKVVKCALWGYVLTSIVTFIVVTIYPYAIRDTASGITTISFFLGYGGFDFIYGVIIINIAIFCYLIKRKNVKNKWLYYIIVLLNTILISMSGYTTAFLLNIGFIVLSYFYSKKYLKIMFLSVIIFMILNTSFLSQIFYNISEVEFLPTIVKSRVYEMARTINGTGEMQYLNEEGERGERFKQSLNLFLEHPITGNMWINKSADYGMHTEWIDRLAQYGLLMVALLFVFWFGLYKDTKKIYKEKNLNEFIIKISYMYFFVLGFLNPCTYVMTVVPLFIIVPYVDEIFTMKQDFLDKNKLRDEDIKIENISN